MNKESVTIVNYVKANYRKYLELMVREDSALKLDGMILNYENEKDFRTVCQTISNLVAFDIVCKFDLNSATVVIGKYEGSGSVYSTAYGHAWIVLKDHTIIDLSYSQFINKTQDELEFDDRINIVDSSSLEQEDYCQNDRYCRLCVGRLRCDHGIWCCNDSKAHEIILKRKKEKSKILTH